MNENSFVMYVVYNNKVHLVGPDLKIIPLDKPFTFSLEDYDNSTKELSNIHYIIASVATKNNIIMSDEELKRLPYHNLISDVGIINIHEQLTHSYIPLTKACGIDHIMTKEETSKQIEKSFDKFDVNVANYHPIRQEHIALYREVKKDKLPYQDIINNDQYQSLLSYDTRRGITFNNYKKPYQAPIDGDLIYPLSRLISNYQSSIIVDENGQGLLFDNTNIGGRK